MGQGKSALNGNQPLYNPALYEVYPKRNDSRYGNILPLVNRQTHEEFVVVSKTLQDEQELRDRYQELDIREKLRHPNLISLLNKNFKKQDDFCSTFYELGLLYEYHSGNLKGEFVERRNIGVGYHEGELWYLAQALLEVVHYLKSQTLTHSDIRPYNVMLTQSGEVKLGEVFMHTRAVSGFSQILNQQLDEYYLSPQQFQRLRSIKDAMNQDYDKDKSEIYSVGMTLLHAATLEDVSEYCYEKLNFNMSNDNISKLLEIVSQQYSSQFTSFLTKMLLENEQERAPVEQLLGEIQQPQVAQIKCANITLVDLIKQSIHEQQEIVQAEPEQYEETAKRSAKPVVEESQQATTVDDDLNARIQAVLAMSRETIAKYGVGSSSTPASQATVVTTVISNPVVFSAQDEFKASQIETRTFLNENTNKIETTTYTQASNIITNPLNGDVFDEVIKRSRQQQQVPEVSQVITNVAFQEAGVSPVATVLATNSFIPAQIEQVIPGASSVYQPYTGYASTSLVSNVVSNNTPLASTLLSSPAQLYQASEVSNTITQAIPKNVLPSYTSYTSAPIEYSFNQNSYQNFIPSSLPSATPAIVEKITSVEQVPASAFTTTQYGVASTVGANGVTGYNSSSLDEQIQKILAGVQQNQASNLEAPKDSSIQQFSYQTYANAVNN